MSILLPVKAILISGSLLLLAHCSGKSTITANPAVKDSVKVTPVNTIPPVDPNAVPLKNMFGVNAFEWDFLQDPSNTNARNGIYEPNMTLIKSFSAVRHYLDWGKLENTEGNYTFNPTNDGSWNYDLIYTRCKAEGITVLADIKTCPPWLVATYPASLQDPENVPMPYGLDINKPASYTKQAMVAFQFAARYGSTMVDKSLLKVDSRLRWTGDIANTVQTGMGVIKYIECDNERDKWWKGPATQQTAAQYAANMSAFYDGDKGKLGANVGVKTADPNMIVVMGGLATCDTNYVKGMIDWCRANRGLKSDGSVNLCFDVINYHYYNTNGTVSPRVAGTSGVAPELSEAGKIADAFVTIGKANKVPVWVTESGYDINQGSTQKTIAIGSKSVLLTQADWNLRTALLYMRHGIQNLYYYLLFDATANSATQYATSGMNNVGSRRPTADYILQTNKLIGNYTYSKTISADPLVDVYVSGTKTMYVLTVPDQKGRSALYSLDLGTATSANVYKPTAGADAMTKTTGITVSGKLNVTVTETPLFIEVAN